jgi:hypothetical protein
MTTMPTAAPKWTQSPEITKFHEAQMETRNRVIDASKAAEQPVKTGGPAVTGEPSIQEVTPGIFGLNGTSGNDQFEIQRRDGRVHMSVQSPGKEAVRRDVAEADYRSAVVSTGTGGDDRVLNSANNVMIDARGASRAMIHNSGDNVVALDSKGADGIVNRGGKNFGTTAGKGDGVLSSGDNTGIKMREGGVAATVVGRNANIQGAQNGQQDFAAIATDAESAAKLKYDAGTDRGAVMNLDDVGLKDADAGARARWEDVVARPETYQKSIASLDGAKGREIGELQGALGFTAKDSGDGRDTDQIFGKITGGALNDVTGALSANYAAKPEAAMKRRSFSLDEVLRENEPVKPAVVAKQEPVVPAPVVAKQEPVVPAQPVVAQPVVAQPAQPLTAPQPNPVAIKEAAYRERINGQVNTLKAAINRDYGDEEASTNELNKVMLSGSDQEFADAVKQMETKQGRSWAQMMKGPTERADEDWAHFAKQLPAARLNWGGPTNRDNVASYETALTDAEGSFNDDEAAIADVFAKATHSEMRALHRKMDLNAYLGEVFTDDNPLRNALKQRLDLAMRVSE